MSLRRGLTWPPTLRRIPASVVLLVAAQKIWDEKEEETALFAFTL